MDELEHTIGRDPSGSGGRYAEIPARAGRLGPVLLLVSIAAIIFAAIAAFILWRDGTLSRFFGPEPIRQTQKVRNWIIADMETGRPSPVPTGKALPRDAPPNEIEPLINPQAMPLETAEPEAAADPAE